MKTKKKKSQKQKRRNDVSCMASTVSSPCNPAKLVSGDVVYPHRKDLKDKQFYQCPDHPDHFVGCHPDTDIPLGFMASPELRKLRSQVHRLFDPIWRDDDELSRTKAYKWFAEQMELPSEVTHVGMFNTQQCNKAILLLNSFHETKKQRAHEQAQIDKWKPKEPLNFED